MHKIIITGGSGFLGYHTRVALRRRLSSARGPLAGASRMGRAHS